jgi:hypothetical protein
MDVSSLAGQALAMVNQNTSQAVQIAVLKKTLEIQSNSILTLLETAAQPLAASNPSHLGNNIDTQA